MNIEAVVLKYCICESVCIQQVLGDGKRDPNAGHPFSVGRNGYAMEHIRDGNCSALDWWRSVFFHTFSAWMQFVVICKPL